MATERSGGAAVTIAVGLSLVWAGVVGCHGESGAGSGSDDPGKTGRDTSAPPVAGGGQEDPGPADASVPRDSGPAADLGAPPSPDAQGPPGPDTTPDTGPGVPCAPPFDPTVCAAAPHAWLPPWRVGGVVSFEEAGLTNVTPPQIEFLLDRAGLGRFGPVPCGARNFRLRYVTQDRGVLREATALVGVPTGLSPGERRPIALWLHGTSGFSDACAPSADPVEGPVSTTLLASLGYLAVAPDYLGMLGFGDHSPPGTISPYVIGEPTAIASLDAIRAARTALARHSDLPQGDADRVVVWGASQGGHAAFFTERIAPHYAPELRIVAAAAMVPATDLVGLAAYGAAHLGETTWAVVAALTAMRAWYGAPPDMTGILTNTEPLFLARRLPEVMASSCSLDRDLVPGVDGTDDIFLPGFLTAAAEGRWDDVPPFGCYLRVNSVAGSPVPRVSDTPFLVAFGETDSLVITAIERADMARLCEEEGYRIEYFECAGKGHVEAALATLPYLRRWTEARLAGQPLPAAPCTFPPPLDCDALTRDP